MNIVMRSQESMCRQLGTAMLAMAFLLLLALATGYAGEGKETATTEEILNILKEKNIVTDEQYQELMMKAEAEKKAAEETYDVKWDSGIQVNRKDDAVKVKVGGRIHFDWAAIDPDSSL